jgi:hypothetical protein
MKQLKLSLMIVCALTIMHMDANAKQNFGEEHEAAMKLFESVKPMPRKPKCGNRVELSINGENYDIDSNGDIKKVDYLIAPKKLSDVSSVNHD